MALHFARCVLQHLHGPDSRDHLADDRLGIGRRQDGVVPVQEVIVRSLDPGYLLELAGDEPTECTGRESGDEDPGAICGGEGNREVDHAGRAVGREVPESVGMPRADEGERRRRAQTRSGLSRESGGRRQHVAPRADERGEPGRLALCRVERLVRDRRRPVGLRVLRNLLLDRLEQAVDEGAREHRPLVHLELNATLGFRLRVGQLNGKDSEQSKSDAGGNNHHHAGLGVTHGLPPFLACNCTGDQARWNSESQSDRPGINKVT